jgi:hypothetical protein
MLALQRRYKTCRPGYYFIDNKRVRMSDNSIIEKKMLKAEIL